MYPNEINNPVQHSELLQHKEFASLKISQGPKTKIDDLINEKNILRMRSYQKFPKYFMSPNSAYKRMCLKFAPGTGKTATVLKIADEYTNYYYDSWKKGDVLTPSIVVIGFSKQIFMRELFKRPEFGFVSREEIEKEQKLRNLAENGTKADQDALVEFYTMLKKRLTKKSQKGFFKFYGYKEFFNRIFIFTNLEKLKTLLNKTVERKNLSEEDILLGLQNNLIKINMDLIDELINSLVICDEIHNVYNSLNINNYGIALRIAFLIQDIPEIMKKYVDLSGKLVNGEDRENTIMNSRLRVILLSATPLNNSPTEIIDFINLLVDPKKIMKHGGIRINKSYLFKNQNELLPDGLDKIKDLLYGHVLFLEDSNPEYFPTLNIKGQEIPVPKKLQKKYGVSDTIPYLKFQRCEISDFHLNTYNSVYQGTLPPDGSSLLDFVFPNPDSNKIGIYKTRDVKYKINNADEKWKEKIGINILYGKTTDQWYVSGELLELKNLRKYSSKYARLVELLHENLYTQKGKAIINHPAVKMSGVLLLQEILKKNGFIDANTSPVDSTLCARCGNPYINHQHNQKNRIKHEFYPARFILLHGEMDKMELARNVEKFKSWNNLDGDYYKVIIGSRVINEGIDFSEVREVYITSFVDNYSELIQIVGRAIRQGSHSRLTPEKRNVNLHVLTHKLKNNQELFHEELRYLTKSIDYKIIQKIDRAINEIAVDGPINKDIIKPNVLNYNGLRREKYSIDIGIDLDKIKTLTHEIFHINDEKDIILYILKRIFIEFSTVWKYSDLWEAVKNPPFHVHVNSQLFSEDNFKNVLEKLLYKNTLELAMKKDLIDYLFDSNDYRIYINSESCKVVYISEFLMVIPLKKFSNNNRIGENIKNVPVVSIENWLRNSIHRDRVINITNKLQTQNTSYDDLKLQFYEKYNKAKIKEIPKSIERYGINFHINLVQEAISYMFALLTTNAPQSEYHNFYMKILYFYSQLDLILFANHISGYEDYADSNESMKPDNAFLINSMTNILSQQDINANKFNNFVESINTHSNHKIHKNPIKVPANILPVGHFITSFNKNNPVKWNPEKETWDDIYNITNKTYNEKENNIIIGFYELNPVSLEMRFKLRNPVSKKVLDTRKIEKGMVCSTYKKEEIMEILKKLDLKDDTSNNIKDLCISIKVELLRREIQERKNYKTEKVRWFYMHFETQPYSF